MFKGHRRNKSELLIVIKSVKITFNITLTLVCLKLILDYFELIVYNFKLILIYFLYLKIKIYF